MKKIHRFIIDVQLEPSLTVRDKPLVHQWAKVLKFQVGEELELCDGRSHEARYRIRRIEKNEIELERDGDVRENDAEAERHVTLYAAVLKREHFEMIVQKATECGVAEIVPLITDRTIKKNVNVERLHEIAKEAAEQSGRGRVPNVHEPLSLKAALAHAQMNDRNDFLDVEGESMEVMSATSRLGLFVGPEGGWMEAEVEQAKKAHVRTYSLGPRVLRGETAAVIAVFLATAGHGGA